MKTMIAAAVAALFAAVTFTAAAQVGPTAATTLRWLSASTSASRRPPATCSRWCT